MDKCVISSFLRNELPENERVRIQTQAHSVYEGTIKKIDCMGILFIPSDKEFHPAYILYPDIRKVMLPDHK